MIAKLRGFLDSFSADHAVIDVGGVGYLVAASTRTLANLGAIGSEVVLHTEMQVSEDAIRLVGFVTAERNADGSPHGRRRGCPLRDAEPRLPPCRSLGRGGKGGGGARP
jgi:hypothetical protein